MSRLELLKSRSNLVIARNKLQRLREKNSDITEENITRKEKQLAPLATFDIKGQQQIVNDLSDSIESAVSTFEGVYHSSIQCKDVVATKCSSPARWHPGRKVYALCGDPICSNYYICHCGKKFGEHF